MHGALLYCSLSLCMVLYLIVACPCAWWLRAAEFKEISIAGCALWQIQALHLFELIHVSLYRCGRYRVVGTGWTVHGSNCGGGEIFFTLPDWPQRPSQPSSKWVLSFFPGGKAFGAWRWHSHPLLAPRLKKVYSYASLSRLCLHGVL